MTIGVCDVNPDETQRTVYFLRSQIKNNIIDNENVRFVSYNLDSVMLDIDYQKFDCDIFITELLYPNGKNGVNLAKRINAGSSILQDSFLCKLKSLKNWTYTRRIM